MRGYPGGFGLVTKKDGETAVVEGVLKALGLK
jgi:hypothetical protein